MEVHVLKSLTIPTGRYRSAKVEYGLTVNIKDGVSRERIQAEFKRVRKIIDAELRRERRKIEEEENDD